MGTSAVVALPARIAPRIRVWAWPALLVTCSIAGVVGVLKGIGPTVVDGTQFYWLFSYEHGFVRRALIGTLVRPILERASFDQVAPYIAAAHVIVCLGIIATCHAFFTHAVRREESFDARITLSGAFLVLMCSQWLTTLAHDVGYVDVYLVSLVLAGLWLILREQYVAAAAAMMVGPLVHEAFLFMWAPVAIVLSWSALTIESDRRRKLLAALTPVLSTAAVAFFQSDAAAARTIDALPLSAGIKDGLKAYQIEQTLRSSFHEMVRYQYPGNLHRIEIAAAYFLLPSAVIVWAAAYCYWPRWRAPWTTLLVMVIATLSPLTILLFAWDLSRFLVWANLAAAIALLTAGAPNLTRRRP